MFLAPSRKFTPRKAASRWSDINPRRYAALKAGGLLTSAGIERPPTGKSNPSPVSEISSAIRKRLKANPQAWKRFEQLAPSHRQAYVGWVESAKREETRDRRLTELIELLAAGKTLGMK